MKQFFVITMLIFVCTINALAQTPTPAPVAAATVGNVCRVIQFGTRPGKNGEFTRFRREHTKPILEEQKRQGLILSFAFYTKPVSNGPDDWDIAQITCFKNYAEAIDFDAERMAKLNAIALKHYGSTEAMTKANDSQTDLRVVFSSFLMREQF
jgi:hypothetical protein